MARNSHQRPAFFRGVRSWRVGTVGPLPFHSSPSRRSARPPCRTPRARLALSIAARPTSTFATRSPPPRRVCRRAHRLAAALLSATASTATAVRCECSSSPASRSTPRSQSSAIARWLASESGRLGLAAADLGSLVARARLHHPRDRRPPPALPAGGRRHPGVRFRDRDPRRRERPRPAQSRRTPRRVTGAAPSRRLRAATAALAAGQQPTARPERPTLVWLPVAGALRLAWHVVVAADEDVADVLVDAQSSELLIRRSRARDAQAIGRVFQSAATAAATPRQPDPMPLGAGGTPGCPPPANYELRPLDTPFRDPATVVASTGRLEGNNVAGLSRRRRRRRRAARRPPTDGCSTSRSTRPGRPRPRCSSARTSSTTSSTTWASTRPRATSRPTTSAAAASAAIPCS